MKLPILSDRNMRVLLAGQSMNMLGNTAMLVVLGIWVKDLTGSSGDAGLIYLLLGASAFLAPVTGLLVDRFPRRLMLIINDAGTGAVMALLLFVHARAQVWIIYLVAGGYGASGQIYRAARGGLVHSMVPDELLGDANGVLSSLTQVLRIVGPLAGAGAYAAWGGGVVAVADIGTFGLSIASYLALPGGSGGSSPRLARRMTSDRERPDRDRPDRDRPERRPPGEFARELVAGIRHVAKHPVIRRMVLASVVAFGGAGMIDVAMFSLVDAGLHRSTSLIGVLTSLEGAGGVVTGLGAGPLMRRFGEYTIACAGFLLIGAGLAVSATATLPGAVIGALLLGVGLPMVLVAELTVVQRRTAADLQGRAIAASEALINTPFTISIGIGAAIIGAVGFRVIYLGCAAGFVAVGLALLPYLKVTRPEPPPASSAGTNPQPVETSPTG